MTTVAGSTRSDDLLAAQIRLRHVSPTFVECHLSFCVAVSFSAPNIVKKTENNIRWDALLVTVKAHGSMRLPLPEKQRSNLEPLER